MQVFEAAYSLAADVKRDKAIADRLRSLSFLTEVHLGVEPLVDSAPVSPPLSVSFVPCCAL